jgi:hypothetical protein
MPDTTKPQPTLRLYHFIYGAPKSHDHHGELQVVVQNEDLY